MALLLDVDAVKDENAFDKMFGLVAAVPPLHVPVAVLPWVGDVVAVVLRSGGAEEEDVIGGVVCYGSLPSQVRDTPWAWRSRFGYRGFGCAGPTNYHHHHHHHHSHNNHVPRCNIFYHDRDGYCDTLLIPINGSEKY